MVIHLVTFRWKEDVTPGAVAGLCDELAAFRRQVGCLVDYHFGPDLGLRQGNADFGVMAVVGTPAEVSEYLDHPAHKELFTRVIAPMCESRTAVQIEAPGQEWPAAEAG